MLNHIPLNEPYTMPTTYLIVESRITDPEAFKRYMAVAPEAVRAFNGEYLVRGTCDSNEAKMDLSVPKLANENPKNCSVL